MEEFLEALEARVAYHQSRNQGIKWRLHKDVQIFVNDDFHCPLCDGWFKTNYVYMVDDRRRKILGCWHYPSMIPVGNYGKEVVHPHADAAGGLCMGTASRVAQLLFNGISPGNHYRPTDQWLLAVGHDCPKLKKQACNLCGYEEYQTYSVMYSDHYFCSQSCWWDATKTLCRVCIGPLIRGAVRNVCSDCFPNVAYKCGSCETLMLPEDLTLVGNHHVCPTCFDTKEGRCRTCLVTLPYKRMAAGRCPQCKLTRCQSCGDQYKFKELDCEGRCRHCTRILEYVCPCSSPVRSEGDICPNCVRCNCCLDWVEPRTTRMHYCIKCVNCVGGWGTRCSAVEPNQVIGVDIEAPEEEEL